MQGGRGLAVIPRPRGRPRRRCLRDPRSWRRCRRPSPPCHRLARPLPARRGDRHQGRGSGLPGGRARATRSTSRKRRRSPDPASATTRFRPSPPTPFSWSYHRPRSSPSISTASWPWLPKRSWARVDRLRFGSPSSVVREILDPLAEPRRELGERGAAGSAAAPKGRTSFRSIKDHQPPLGAGDRRVEPAGPVLGGAAEAVVEDDDVLPLRPLALWQVMA